MKKIHIVKNLLGTTIFYADSFDDVPAVFDSLFHSTVDTPVWALVSFDEDGIRIFRDKELYEVEEWNEMCAIAIEQLRNSFQIEYVD